VQRAGALACCWAVLNCHEQHLAGQGGRDGQRVEEPPARDGIMAYCPQQQAVVPGQIPGAVDRPGGDQVGHRGRHASGTVAGVLAVSAAAKYRFANATSSWVMNAGSA